MSFHGLTHTYASILAMRGVSLQVIEEALGHTNTPMTSRHYAHVVQSYVAIRFERIYPSSARMELELSMRER
jgi:integrase